MDTEREWKQAKRVSRAERVRVYRSALRLHYAAVTGLATMSWASLLLSIVSACGTFFFGILTILFWFYAIRFPSWLFALLSFIPIGLTWFCGYLTTTSLTASESLQARVVKIQSARPAPPPPLHEMPEEFLVRGVLRPAENAPGNLLRAASGDTSHYQESLLRAVERLENEES